MLWVILISLCVIIFCVLMQMGLLDKSLPLRHIARRLVKGKGAVLWLESSGALLVSREGVQRLLLSTDDEGVLLVSLTLDAPGLPDEFMLKRSSEDEHIEFAWLGFGAVSSWSQWASFFEHVGDVAGWVPEPRMKMSGLADGRAQRWELELQWALPEVVSLPYIVKCLEEIIAHERALMLQVVRWFGQLRGEQLKGQLQASSSHELRRFCVAILRTEARFEAIEGELYEALLSEGDWGLALILLNADRIDALALSQREQALFALSDESVVLQELVGPLFVAHINLEQLTRLAGRSASLRLMVVRAWHEGKQHPAHELQEGFEGLVTELYPQQLQEVLALALELDELDWTSLIERLRFVAMDRALIGGLLRLLEKRQAKAPDAELTALMARSIIKAMARAQSHQLMRLASILRSRGSLSSAQVLREELGSGWMSAEVEQACREVLSKLQRRLGGSVEQGQLTVVEGSVDQVGALSQAQRQGGELEVLD